jgi:hypothetical protein
MKSPRLIALLAAFAMAVPAFAGLNTAIIVLPVETQRSAPAVALVQPADYLCAVVTLRTTTKDIDRQSAAMRDGLQRITAAIEKAPRFQLHQGPARFAGNPGPLFSAKTGSDPANLATNLRILFPLQGTNDVFESLRQLRRFIGTLAPGADSELSLVSISLAVNEPEQYRPRLLQLISEQARTIQQSFGTRSLIIDGLQNPVLVRQVDDSNVELSVDYQISANVESRP